MNERGHRKTDEDNVALGDKLLLHGGGMKIKIIITKFIIQHAGTLAYCHALTAAAEAAQELLFCVCRHFLQLSMRIASLLLYIYIYIKTKQKFTPFGQTFIPTKPVGMKPPNTFIPASKASWGKTKCHYSNHK